MSSPTLFGVYMVAFPFLESGQSKVRRVIIVSKPHGRHNVIAVVPASARAKPEAVDVALSGWKSAGFIKPSVARVHRLTTMLQADLLAELGMLQQDDVQTLQAALRIFMRL